jgi:hypothetical protein
MNVYGSNFIYFLLFFISDLIFSVFKELRVNVQVPIFFSTLNCLKHITLGNVFWYVFLFYYLRRIPSGKWTYTGLSWNRQTRTAILYKDTYFKRLVVNSNIKNIDIRVTNHTFYEIGFKKDSKQRFRGCLRDLTVFDRALNPGEMQFRYRKQ